MSRDDPRDIRIRNLEVWIDGKHAADLKYGERHEATLPHGEHTIRVTNRLSTKDLAVAVAEGGPVTLRASNRAGLIGGAMMALVGVGPYRVHLERI